MPAGFCEPDPAGVVGVVEERWAEVRSLDQVPGTILRDLTNRALVCNLELLAEAGGRPPRWAGFMVALELERRARKEAFGAGYADPEGQGK